MQLISGEAKMKRSYRRGVPFIVALCACAQAPGPNRFSKPVSVVVSFDDNGHEILAAVVIVNKSDHEIQVDPEQLTLVLLAPQKPPKKLEHVPPKHIIGDINSRVRG